MDEWMDIGLQEKVIHDVIRRDRCRKTTSRSELYGGEEGGGGSDVRSAQKGLRR